MSVLKLNVYRGAPKGFLRASELEGKGGVSNEMLGSGMYTTTDYELAEIYAPRKTDCVYEIELEVDESLILNLDSTSCVPITLTDENYGDAAPPLMVPYRISPFYIEVAGSAYVFGIETLDDLDELYPRPLPTRLRFSDEFLTKYKPEMSDLKTNQKNLTHQINSLPTEELLELARTSSDAFEFTDYVFENLNEDEFDSELTREQNQFIETMCHELYVNFEKDFGLGSDQLSKDMGVPKDRIFLADLNDLSGIASDAGFAVLSVSGILQYNETLIIDPSRVKMKIKKPNEK